MSKRSRVGKILEVTWEDAWHSSEYADFEKIKGATPLILKSCGYCIRDDKSGITLATDDNGSDYRHLSHRPASMIRKVRILGQSK